MKTNLFDYELPESSIAQHPLPDRDAARLCVLGRDAASHARFRDWPELVPDGALVVLNDTRVIKARLLGRRRGSGGRIEVLLVRRLTVASTQEQAWLALGRANRPLGVGTVVEMQELTIEVVARDDGGRSR